MPPKGGKKGAKQAEKAKATARQKIVEDKTFGLKNKKKSSKVQKYVQQVQKSVSQVDIQKKADAQSRKEKKKAELEQQKELDALFAMSIKQPKVPPGVDPKTILCEFFKHGKCTKSFKCKFSHDLEVQRKGPKVDLYSDKRDEDMEENMEDWDQETLEKAIAQKHGSDNQNLPTTIVCKYFLDAVEKRQYGWFWQCPNGKECKYRHALPPGYILKSQMKQLLAEEAANQKSVEEEIEEERAKVDARTPITPEIFAEWQAERIEKERKENDALRAERRKKGILTGREIFEQEGFIATDDASASDAISKDINEEEEIQKMHDKARADLESAKLDAGSGENCPSLTIDEEDEDIFEDEDEVLDALLEEHLSLEP